MGNLCWKRWTVVILSLGRMGTLSFLFPTHVLVLLGVSFLFYAGWKSEQLGFSVCFLFYSLMFIAVNEGFYDIDVYL